MSRTWMGLVLVFASCTGQAPNSKGGDQSVPNTDAESDADTDADADADGDTDASSTGVDADGDGVTADLDCDDKDASVYPGADDICGDDRVTDCDRESDDGLVTIDGGDTYDDLGAALSGASEGSQVLLCPGTYTGSFRAQVPLDLVSYGGSAVTLLDGGGRGAVLTVPAGSSITGLTLQNGDNDNGDGGGLVLSSSGALTVVDSVITANRAKNGAGVWLGEDSTAIFSGTAISANTALASGGGLYAGKDTSVDLGDSVVSGNTSAVAGGGVYLSIADLTGGSLTSNSCDAYANPYGTDPQGGGGLSATGPCVVTGTDIGSNTGPTGAGVAINQATVSLFGVSIHDNDSAFGYGGGMWVRQATVTFDEASEIRQNHSGYLGGGVAMYDGSLIGANITRNRADSEGAGVYVSDGTFTDSVIDDNEGGFGTGGGGFFLSPITLTRVSLSGNSAAYGAGMFCSGGYGQGPSTHIDITDSTISGNAATYGGGAIYASGTALVLIKGSDITDNSTASYGYGGAFYLYAALQVTDSRVLRNTAQFYGGGAYVSYYQALASLNTDWGSGADENTPDDVYSSYVYTGFGEGASFSCDGTMCFTSP